MKVRYRVLLVSLFAMLVFSVMPNVQANPDVIYVSAVDATGKPIIIDPTAPVSTNWLVLHSEPAGMEGSIIHLTSWEETNGDLMLSASDQIDFDDGSWWHVDQVMVTIHWTWKTPIPPGFDETEHPATEPTETMPISEDLPDPISSNWHMIYPWFSRPFHITSWEDTDGSTTFNPSDQFDITFEDDGTGPWWAHLDSVSTDLKLTMKWPDPQIPEFPLGWEVVLGLGLTAAVVYTIWKRRPNFKPA